MNEAISQDLTRKGIVFFLKKTTNFCTATIFDIHLVKRGWEKKQKSLTVHMVITNNSRQRKASQQGTGEPLLGLNFAGFTD